MYINLYIFTQKKEYIYVKNVHVNGKCKMRKLRKEADRQFCNNTFNFAKRRNDIVRKLFFWNDRRKNLEGFNKGERRNKIASTIRFPQMKKSSFNHSVSANEKESFNHSVSANKKRASTIRFPQKKESFNHSVSANKKELQPFGFRRKRKTLTRLFKPCKGKFN